jgi:CelD/BcsL family acetyltransferase involved in cellulose biosynthesis
MTGARPPVRLRRVAWDAARWESIVSGHAEAEPFHGAAWIGYLQEAFGVEPVVAEVIQDGIVVGHALGGIVRRLGIRILGSPLRGWGTEFLGFLLDDGIDRRAVADAYAAFAFRELGCLHLELGDANLTVPAMTGSRFHLEPGITYSVDLTLDEPALLGGMRPRTRTYVRQAERAGLVVSTALDPTDDPDFAADYHAQLTEVFARQGLAPTYGLDRVRSLIRCVAPSGNLLRLRVRDASGETLSTAIVMGRNRRAVLWGAASRRDLGGSHPNEAMHWAAMRFWRDRGVTTYDLGGAGDYKAKFGAVVVPTPRFVASRSPVLDIGRSAVRSAFRARQVIAGRLRRTPPQPSGSTDD